MGQKMLQLLRRYRIFLLAVIVLLASVLLYSYNLRNKQTTTFFERAVLTFSEPFQTVIDDSYKSVVGLWNHYLFLVDAKKENDALKNEVAVLRFRLQEVEEISLQNKRLRKLLDFVDDLDRPALPAQVIGEDISNWARTIIIDKGLNSGLRHGMPVVAAQGVVGRVIKVAQNSARVLLITDASSAIAALIQRTRTRGVARGMGEDLSVEYALNQDDIEVGDLMITSGMGGVFPKGLPLGRVLMVEKDQFGLFQKVKVQTVVDFSHLEEVMVIVGED